MPKCIVVGCPNALRTVRGVPMFTFPKNATLRKKWLEVIKADSSAIGENTRVCCRHFAENDTFHFSTRTKLKAGKVPHLNLTSETECPSINVDEHLDREKNETVSNGNAPQHKNIKRKKVKSPLYGLKSQFLIENFINNDRKINYYTGIPTFKILRLIYHLVFKSEAGPQGTVHQTKTQRPLQKKWHKLSPLNEFFLTLMRLRRGFDHETIADMFRVSVATVNRICTTWINLLYVKLGSYNIFPHRNVLMAKAPPAFARKYPNVIGSIDCTEFNIETPSSLVRQSQCYSTYKSTNTLKSLIMINAAGAITFVSSLYTGAISDKSILERSGFVELLRKKIMLGELQYGDIILADKGFNVKNLLEDVGIELNIPTFRITGMQFQPNEVEYCRWISHERIHVERAIRRLKSFKILSNRIPISLLGCVNQIYTVCALLTNFKYPLRKQPRM